MFSGPSRPSRALLDLHRAALGEGLARSYLFRKHFEISPSKPFHFDSQSREITFPLSAIPLDVDPVGVWMGGMMTWCKTTDVIRRMQTLSEQRGLQELREPTCRLTASKLRPFLLTLAPALQIDDYFFGKQPDGQVIVLAFTRRLHPDLTTLSGEQVAEVLRSITSEPVSPVSDRDLVASFLSAAGFTPLDTSDRASRMDGKLALSLIFDAGNRLQRGKVLLMPEISLDSFEFLYPFSIDFARQR